MMRDRIITVINKYEGKYPDADTRATIMSDINETVFGNIPVMTDITTPEEVDDLILCGGVSERAKGNGENKHEYEGS